MADDLVAADGEVHAKAREILVFWFEWLMPEQHFSKSEALDATISERFGALRDQVLATRAKGWRADRDTLLAAVILLDQFSRNMHRGTADAFAGDGLALELSQLAIAREWDRGMTTAQRQFLYMPFMHAEDAELQRRSIALFESLGDAYVLKFAREHAEVIAQFGRFPSRNAALGRISTAEEQAYLSRPDAGW
ncbi:DUF924 family protein [Stakelama tenebrarum]|uniref:DUF924 domain-containing protein n=1 Tax=Stakelama tenebrarum TaxID=2711215 RepID=A0A6G6Y5S0_9SPHN|nr:DUF924 family protein [Sphingosinithalassobacter tenebrarum]QIG80265.1 DUF924 domain-containing protein [Sphingosinithalassobacter tenebrarum]